MVKPAVSKKKGEAGQAVVLVVAAISIFLLGAVGLAIDGSQLYAQRQMAQAAADSAATAAIVSVYNGTNTGPTNTFGASAYDCTSSDTTTPCVYARTNGFGTTSGTTADTVHVDPNPGVAACGSSSTCSLDASTPNEIQVTITRPVPMTLTKLLGLSSFNVKASATAAVLDVLSPIPILVLHPTLKGSFSANGGGAVCSGSDCAISIFGGPSRSIQVNSSAANCSISGNPGTCSPSSQTVDLSQAGPNGTGADFGDIGGPGSYPGTLLLGSTGAYRQPVGFFDDPLRNMPAPPNPISGGSIQRSGPTAYLDPGQGDCPLDLKDYTNSPSASQCQVWSPGYYPVGINLSRVYAIFRPGIYYINHGGFNLGSQTIGRMAMTAPYNTDDTPAGDPLHTSWTIGMLVYNDPGVDGTSVKPNSDNISIAGANAGKINNYNFPDPVACGTDSSGPLGGTCLVGANGGVLSASACIDPAAADAMYYGVLFFQSRTTPASLTDTLGGGGGMSLKGTIYLHDPTNGYADYQMLNLQGKSGSSTKVQGEIIVDALGLGGTSGITMNLSTMACYTVRKMALIQ